MKSNDELNDRIMKIKKHYKETFQTDLPLEFFLNWLQTRHAKHVDDYFKSWFCDDRPVETQFTIRKIEDEIIKKLNPPVVTQTEVKKKPKAK